MKFGYNTPSASSEHVSLDGKTISGIGGTRTKKIDGVATITQLGREEESIFSEKKDEKITNGVIKIVEGDYYYNIDPDTNTEMEGETHIIIKIGNLKEENFFNKDNDVSESLNNIKFTLNSNNQFVNEKLGITITKESLKFPGRTVMLTKNGIVEKTNEFRELLIGLIGGSLVTAGGIYALESLNEKTTFAKSANNVTKKSQDVIKEKVNEITDLVPTKSNTYVVPVKIDDGYDNYPKIEGLSELYQDIIQKFPKSRGEQIVNGFKSKISKSKNNEKKYSYIRFSVDAKHKINYVRSTIYFFDKNGNKINEQSFTYNKKEKYKPEIIDKNSEKPSVVEPESKVSKDLKNQLGKNTKSKDLSKGKIIYNIGTQPSISDKKVFNGYTILPNEGYYTIIMKTFKINSNIKSFKELGTNTILSLHPGDKIDVRLTKDNVFVIVKKGKVYIGQ